ncbi:MAG: hypothetical protein ABIO02_00075, partial [Patescibacteria group bacterium]
MEYFTQNRLNARKNMEVDGITDIYYPATETPVQFIQFDDGSRALYLGRQIVMSDFLSHCEDPSVEIRDEDRYVVYDPMKYDISVVPYEEFEYEDNYEELWPSS